MGVTRETTKIDDNTLSERIVNLLESSASWYRESNITRTFNFLARSLTIATESVLWNKTNNTPPGMATAVTVQNFADIEGKEEISRAHAKLVELKGKPPALEDVMKDLGKKTIKLPVTANG